MLITNIDSKGHTVTARVDDENRSIFRAIHGFAVVLDLLECNMDDATIAEEICKSLNNLIGDYDSSTCEGSWVKCYPILLSLIDKHAHNLPICYLSLRALYNIVLGVRDLIDTKEGIVGLLKTLKIHSDVNIVLWTCKVMNSLGLRAVSASWSVLGSEGACQVILRRLGSILDTRAF